ncbi:hypothetical protein HK099_006162 [Clydaea vesicula]|uniref:Bestrophin homolog n=1 Tax=Clydaea vesicula TaxID=447962 RepID=A0AAD5U087_9FUNG|nr:hypothetical protein HK099_006162 [Clydaea vesicula]
MDNLSIFHTIIAMLSAFRTNRSFDRYWLGAQTWTLLTTQIRNLSRLIFNSVRCDREEKIIYLKLLVAIAVANKYSLRGENAYFYKELLDLIPDNDFKKNGSMIKKMKKMRSNDLNFTATRDKIEDFEDAENVKNAIPTLSIVVNVPLEIAHRVSAFIRKQRSFGNIDLEDIPAINTGLNEVINSLTKFELMFVPVPKSYDIHMKQILIVYFISLPFQLVANFGYGSVLVVFFLSTGLFGIDSIAGEIEDPFGTDENDLPLDFFCSQLLEDVEYIIEISELNSNRASVQSALEKTRLEDTVNSRINYHSYLYKCNLNY